MRKNKPAEVTRLEKKPDEGLSFEEVELRRQAKLCNSTKQKTGKSYLRIATDNIFTYFNMIWILMAIVLIYFKQYGDIYFLGVVGLSTTIAIVQEMRSKRIVSKLAMVTAPKVTVIRGGKEEETETDHLVLDDIFKLKMGNQIPVDCIILEGKVAVNESLLTGESVPVRKQAGDTLLAGSFLTSGSCVCRADRVGKDCYIQTIAKEAKAFKQPKSDLFRDMNRIIKVIGILIIPIAAGLFLYNYFGMTGEPIEDVVVKTMSSLIGMIPAGVYLLVSVALAVGIIKLARRKTLVNNLYAIEMLARTNILCLDKTGTITDGTMSVAEVHPFAEGYNIAEAVAAMMSAQEFYNSTAEALVRKFGKESSWKVSENVPYSSENKYTATSFGEKGTYVIGAYEFIKPTDKNADTIREKISSYTSLGYRVLALAASKKSIAGEKLPSDMVTIGLIAVEDTIRPDACETISWFKQNGVQVKIISGDDPQTVSVIAARVNVENAGDAVSMAGVPLDQVKDYAQKYTVFGRVSPEQKHALVKALKEAGNIVGMTGDGVNDTLALKEADCSIAMAEGSDVARSISHLVLMDSKFSSLPAVVEEGRRVINNVQASAVLFFMKTFFSFMFAFAVMPFGKITPFSPHSYYIMELFVIGFASVCLALQPNKELIQGNFIKNVIKRSLPYAFILFFSVFITLFIGGPDVLSGQHLKEVATYILIFVGFFNLCALCFPFTRYRFLICSLVLGLTFLAAYLLPTMFFGEDYTGFFTSNMGWILGIVLLFAAIYVVNVLLLTSVFKRRALQKKLDAKLNKSTENVQ